MGTASKLCIEVAIQLEVTDSMQPYSDLTGNSGIVAFGLGDHSIDVEFRGGARYRYDDIRPGRRELATMRRLAIAGKGLATFISQHIGDRYAAKLPAARMGPASASAVILPFSRKQKSS